MLRRCRRLPAHAGPACGPSESASDLTGTACGLTGTACGLTRAAAAPTALKRLDMADDRKPLSVAELERWVEFGARWRALTLTDGAATVELCQCTGELVELRETDDPQVIAYLRAHRDEGELA